MTNVAPSISLARSAFSSAALAACWADDVAPVVAGAVTSHHGRKGATYSAMRSTTWAPMYRPAKMAKFAAAGAFEGSNGRVRSPARFNPTAIATATAAKKADHAEALRSGSGRLVSSLSSVGATASSCAILSLLHLAQRIGAMM